MRSRPYDLVLFDNDGVLVDSETLSGQVLSELLTESGLPTTFEESVATYLGSSMARVVAVAEERLGGPLPEDFVETYDERVFARFRSELRPVPGIEEALETIGRPRAVVSSGSPERIELTLTLTELIDHFDGHLYSAEEVDRGKPHPDLFLHAAERMGVPADRCVVVEDSPLGVEAARRAGMDVIGYARMTPAERLKSASLGLITDMRRLPERLGFR